MINYIKDEITVILSLWKRENYVQQLEYIINQRKKPYQIWIYQNESHLNIDIPEDIKQKYNISIIQSKDMNFKFYGRFAIALLCETEYVAVFDDDTIPGNRWLENCINTSKKYNCIVGANGRTLDTDLSSETPLKTHYVKGIGDGATVSKDTQVSFVGHCWFLKTEWIKNLWKDPPFTWDNGEDIHLAASCKIYDGIECFVPQMPNDDRSLWGDMYPQLGGDEHASWKRDNHNDLRYKIIKHWHSKGWNPVGLQTP